MQNPMMIEILGAATVVTGLIYSLAGASAGF